MPELDGTATGTRRWLVVVPVKRLDVAKSRLAEQLGGLRRDLALAMAQDTVDVASSCPGVRVVVVTDDGDVAESLRQQDVRVLRDEPGAGINAALHWGARTANDGEGVAALAADVPSVRPVDLMLALARASAHREAFVTDAAGTGTTLYAAVALAEFAPRFGAGSAIAHGATAMAIDTHRLARLQCDVDTIDDLRAAAALGLGWRTSQVVARLGLIDVPAVRPAS